MAAELPALQDIFQPCVLISFMDDPKENSGKLISSRENHGKIRGIACVYTSINQFPDMVKR